MAERARVAAFAWVAGAVGLAAVGFAIVSAFVDLGFANSAAGPASLVVAGVGLSLAAWGFLKARKTDGTTRDVRASGHGAVAAGGGVRGNAFGRKAMAKTIRRTERAGRPEAPGAQSVSATGEKSVAAGGDVEGNAFGDESQT